MLLLFWIIFVAILAFGIWEITNLELPILKKWLLGVSSFCAYSLIILAIGALFDKGGFLVFYEIELILPILIIVILPAILYMTWEKLKRKGINKAVLVVTGIIWAVSYFWILFVGVASSLQFP